MTDGFLRNKAHFVFIWLFGVLHFWCVRIKFVFIPFAIKIFRCPHFVGASVIVLYQRGCSDKFKCNKFLLISLCFVCLRVFGWVCVLCDFKQFVKANIEINLYPCQLCAALSMFICSCDYAAFDLIYLYARIALIYGNFRHLYFPPCRGLCGK